MRSQFLASGSYLGPPDRIEIELFNVFFEMGSSLIGAHFLCFKKSNSPL
jgi:hypothetical protein